MPSYTEPSGVGTPFGRNEFLRSTKILQTESYTLAADTVTAQTIDGVGGQKILQPGTVLAKITSGKNAGKVGPFQAGGTAETQTLTKAGTVSGGTFTLSYEGEVTTAIAWDATAADVQAALEALSTIGLGGVVVTGGPLNTGPFTVAFKGQSGDLPALVADTTNLTGAGAGVTVAEGTKGTAGANDGRQTTSNIVGLNLTFLPWQLMDRDVEVSAVYECSAVQGWCLEYDANGAAITLTNTTADAMRGTKGLDILFK
jgi:hypothetical protein